MKTISVDLMSGDSACDVRFTAVERVLQVVSDLHVILVGQQHIIQPLIQRCDPALLDRLTVQVASQVIDMDEDPRHAMRNKKDSSMRVAIDQVKLGKADACVSAGNTGALMATSRFVLKTVPGIDRPAIMTQFPTMQKRRVHVLDLGANVDSKPDHLLQFAIMGSVVASAAYRVERPKVGLLNVGVEEIKGNEQVKQAAILLQQCSLINYIGYVEGTDLFSDRADVVVCDGFVGNIALKAVEGTLRLFADSAKSIFLANWKSKLASVPALPLFKALKVKMDPRTHNGASFVGLNGIVVKSHGSADEVAFANAIHQAIREVDSHVPGLIGDMLVKLSVD